MGMLDSNTDRSFFMIGAIIVAGLVIGLLVTVIGGDFSDGLSRTVNGLFDNADAIITGESGSDSGGPEFPLVTDADAVVISSGAMTSYTGSSPKITIPETLDGVTVKAISGGVSGRSGAAITHVILPSTLTHVNTAGFQFHALEVVDIPAGVSIVDPYSMGGTVQTMGTYGKQFYDVYYGNGRQAGRYVWNGTTYIKR